MSAYITINDDEAKELLRDFQSGCFHDLGEFGSIREIGEGYSNSVFELRTTTGVFICKVIELAIDSLAATSTELQHVIQLACHAMGMRVPQPLGRLVEVQGRKAQLMRHVDGLNLVVINPHQARVLGARAAEFQLGLQGVSALCPRRRVKPTKLLISELIASSKRFNSPTRQGELAYLAGALDLSLAFLRTRRDLERRRVPRGMTHADLNRGNILFTSDGDDVAAFLDFDSVAPGFLLRDLVKLIYEFGILQNENGRFYIDRELTLALIEGYSTARPLSRGELESVEAVLDMTSRWQAASHQKLHLVGRNCEDATAIDLKASLIKSSRHTITKWIREIHLL